MMTPTPPSRQALVDTLAEAIRGWSPHQGPARWADARFDALARQVFAYQTAHNAPYAAFCAARGVDAEALTSYLEIPAVPTDVFKHVALTTGQPTIRTFLTSGTTQGARGAHRFATLELYRAALHGPFERACNPGSRRMRMLALVPSPHDAPESSLSFMVGELLARWGDERSAFFVERAGEDGALTLGVEAFERALVEAEAEGVVTMVLGTGFAFVECFDRIARSVRLADGSRVMETGGFKGRSREIGRAQLYDLFEDRMGVARQMCVSEYSMTELSSQAYTAHLRHAVRGDTLDDPAPGDGLWAPPWARIDLVDPLTFAPVADGQVGLIRWTDLANLDSVCAVQTSDLGVRHPSGALMMLGRAPESELRGCGLMIEEIVTREQGV